MPDHNRALLVLLDSRLAASLADAENGVVAALDHWGMPYLRHDLAQGQPGAGQVENCAAIVLAQQDLGSVLTAETAGAIAKAVADGTGYVGCDGNIGYMQPPLQHLVGVRIDDVRPTFGAQTVDGTHWVSEWQLAGERYRFKRPLELACAVPTVPRVRVLVESGGHPGMWITPYGQGRAVQWALPPGLWQREVFGHCEGMDDLLWRGIVWVARKPFSMLALPPFSTCAVSDAIGVHDFDWIETLNEFGFPPHIGVFPDDIDALSEVRGQSNFTDRAVSMMRSSARTLGAEFCPQAATWNRAYLLYCRADGAEIPSAELGQRLTGVDKQFARYGIPWSATLYPHYHQLGYNALPFLQERGVAFAMTGQLPGETWEGEHRQWDCAPYGHPGFATAPLPGSKDFYIVTAGRSHLHTTEQTGPRAYRIRNEAYAWQNDMMWGRTLWQDQCRINDWDAIATAAVRQIRMGLNALFFACPATQEQMIGTIRLEEWAALWQRIAGATAGYERWPRLYSEIAAYARSRHRTRLVDAAFDGTSLSCDLQGSPDLPLDLTIWDDLGDSDQVVRRFDRIMPFVHAKHVLISRL